MLPDAFIFSPSRCLVGRGRGASFHSFDPSATDCVTHFEVFDNYKGLG